MVTSQRLAEMRARMALAAAGLDADRPLTPLESATNEVWAAGDVVVRVNRRTQTRLRREAALAAALPPRSATRRCWRRATRPATTGSCCGGSPARRWCGAGRC